jgi:hypothetical protein
MVTLAMVDVNGNAVSTAIKNQVDALLQANREVNFIVNEIDPTFNVVDVTFAVKGEIGYTDAADLVARVTTAIQDYLSAETWGLPSGGDTITWNNETTIRYLSMADVIKSVIGVRYIETITIGLAGGAQVAADKVMTGVAPMPRPGAIVGTADLS